MEKVNLNLGCGVKVLKGFINVDLYDLKDLKEAKGILHEAEVKGRYIKADVRELPFKDNFADYILASEILEHIPLVDLSRTLLEWIRVLKPGGRMVIKSPDFDEMAKDWLEGFDPKTYSEKAQGIYGNQITEYEVHRSPINRKLLEYFLYNMGIKKGKIWVYPKGHKMVGYPGIKARADRVYRYGEVHVDFRK